MGVHFCEYCSTVFVKHHIHEEQRFIHYEEVWAALPFLRLNWHR
jgi:hypothetical protein